MDKTNEPFDVSVHLTLDGGPTNLRITHSSETFDFELAGQTISMINNGDNSWSIVTGNLSQEKINLIGAEVEKHYKKLTL